MAVDHEAGQTRLKLLCDVDVVRARQAVLRLARARSFSPADQARVDLVVAELATNVLRHAGDGEITITALTDPSDSLVIVCADAGPGMRVRRGYEHLGLGLGLAVVEELTDDLEIRSAGEGTWIQATVTRASK